MVGNIAPSTSTPTYDSLLPNMMSPTSQSTKVKTPVQTLRPPPSNQQIHPSSKPTLNNSMELPRTGPESPRSIARPQLMGNLGSSGIPCALPQDEVQVLADTCGGNSTLRKPRVRKGPVSSHQPNHPSTIKRLSIALFHARDCFASWLWSPRCIGKGRCVMEK